MLNISPIGRNCSRDERNAYETFDLVGVSFHHAGQSGVHHVLIYLSVMTITGARHPTANGVCIAGTLRPPEPDLLYRRPDLLRCLPARLGQDLLPELLV